jgi:hypothetical protein
MAESQDGMLGGSAGHGEATPIEVMTNVLALGPLVSENSKQSPVAPRVDGADGPPPVGVVRAFAGWCKDMEGLFFLLAFVVGSIAAVAAYGEMGNSRESAEAATEALKLQQRSSVLQDRPWLVAETSTFPKDPQPDVAYRAEWKIKNPGRLPATKVTVGTKWNIVPAGQPFDFTPPTVLPGRLRTSTVLGPGESKPLHVDMLVPANWMAGVNAGTHHWYAYGDVTYTWPDGTEGSLAFCVFYDAAAKRWPDCDVHNDVK